MIHTGCCTTSAKKRLENSSRRYGVACALDFHSRVSKADTLACRFLIVDVCDCRHPHEATTILSPLPCGTLLAPHTRSPNFPSLPSNRQMKSSGLEHSSCSKIPPSLGTFSTKFLIRTNGCSTALVKSSTGGRENRKAKRGRQRRAPASDIGTNANVSPQSPRHMPSSKPPRVDFACPTKPRQPLPLPQPDPEAGHRTGHHRRPRRATPARGPAHS
jgi:hypothetical protein